MKRIFNLFNFEIEIKINNFSYSLDPRNGVPEFLEFRLIIRNGGAAYCYDTMSSFYPIKTFHRLTKVNSMNKVDHAVWEN